jgi:SAM-dependent methyltransferase
MSDSLKVWRKVVDIPGSLNPSPLFCDKISKAANLIDIGCGVGRLVSALQRRPDLVIGVDCSLTALLDRSLIDLGAARVAGDAHRLPFRDEVASAVSLQAVLTVIPTVEEQLSVAAEVTRILAPGGFLYIGDFLRNDDDPYYAARYRSGPGGGVFSVTSFDGTHLYWAKHWRTDELVNLWARAFRVDVLRERDVVSRSARRVRGIEILFVKLT